MQLPLGYCDFKGMFFISNEVIHKEEQELIKYTEGLEFLSKTASKLLSSLSIDRIFEFVAQQIYSVADGSIVVVNEFDKGNKKAIIKAFCCDNKEKSFVNKSLGRALVGAKFDFIEMTRELLVPGKLILVEGELYDLAINQRPALKLLMKMLGICDIFLMAFADDEDLLGFVAVLTRGKGFPKKRELIEFVVNEAALAIKRRKAEDLLRASLADKEVLLKEVHHRVKNNLQLISSLLSLQSSACDDKTKAILDESRNRIKSIALVHEALYETKDFSNIDAGKYICKLIKSILYTFDSEDISIDLDIGAISLKITSVVSIGLILNELIVNSIKHAFCGNKGNISISMKKEEGRLILYYSDDGIGIPSGFDLMALDTLGLKLVKTLVDQLEGKIKVIGGKGAKFHMVFPA